MELNNLQLPSSLIAELYRSSLVSGDNTGSAEMLSTPEALPGKAWKFLGDNKKNILLVVNHKSAVHLPDEDLAFLTQILAACNLSLADVAIVNTNNSPQYSYKDYTDHFKSRIILLFGVEPAGFGLPISFPYFQVQSFAKFTFLYSPALHEYDKLLKSKLWVCLKRIFEV